MANMVLDEYGLTGTVAPMNSWLRRLDPEQKEQIKRWIQPVYDARDWARIVMYDECDRHLRALGPENLSALEISSGRRWQQFGFRSFTETHYPDFDICNETLDEKFDVIIADQVFEHLTDPRRAAQNVRSMLAPGGRFIITVPFLLRIHRSPKYDCLRWSEEGLRFFLTDCGFASEKITTGAWGNRGYIKAHLSGKWPRRGFFGSLRNESSYPVVVWAFAQGA